MKNITCLYYLYFYGVHCSPGEYDYIEPCCTLLIFHTTVKSQEDIKEIKFHEKPQICLIKNLCFIDIFYSNYKHLEEKITTRDLLCRRLPKNLHLGDEITCCDLSGRCLPKNLRLRCPQAGFVFLRPYPSELGTVLKKTNPPGSREGFCAEEEIRTPTAVTPLPPQSSASTNFATSAGWVPNVWN